MHGVDYFFVSKAQFEEWLAGNALLEHAIVYGDYKGIPRQQVRKLCRLRSVSRRVERRRLSSHFKKNEDRGIPAAGACNSVRLLQGSPASAGDLHAACQSINWDEG